MIFRLADALPAARMRDVEKAPPAERLAVAERSLDEGIGERLLADPRVAQIVEAALPHFDAERYRLLAWCVMPSHVHVLAEQAQGQALSKIVHSWKSFTANAANRLLGRKEAFWAPEWYDRFMRDDAQFAATRDYIEANPVTAGLCDSPAAWRFSSAFRRV